MLLTNPRSLVDDHRRPPPRLRISPPRRTIGPVDPRLARHHDAIVGAARAPRARCSDGSDDARPRCGDATRPRSPTPHMMQKQQGRVGTVGTAAVVGAAAAAATESARPLRARNCRLLGARLRRRHLARGLRRRLDGASPPSTEVGGWRARASSLAPARTRGAAVRRRRRLAAARHRRRAVVRIVVAAEPLEIGLDGRAPTSGSSGRARTRRTPCTPTGRGRRRSP